MSGARWLDHAYPPTEAAILAGLGEQIEAWGAIRTALRSSYGLEGDLAWGGKKYGWCYHYRAGGRTLCDLYPERGSLTALVIMNAAERIRMVAGVGQFTSAMRSLIDTTPGYHDGLWLWTPISGATADDVLLLLAIKRKPARPHKAIHGDP